MSDIDLASLTPEAFHPDDLRTYYETTKPTGVVAESDLSLADLEGARPVVSGPLVPGTPQFDAAYRAQQAANAAVNSTRPLATQLRQGAKSRLDAHAANVAGAMDVAASLDPVMPPVMKDAAHGAAGTLRAGAEQRLRENVGDPANPAFALGAIGTELGQAIGAGSAASTGAKILGAGPKLAGVAGAAGASVAPAGQSFNEAKAAGASDATATAEAAANFAAGTALYSIPFSRIAAGKGATGPVARYGTAGLEGAAAAAGQQHVADTAAHLGHGGEAPSLERDLDAAAFGFGVGVGMRGVHDFSAWFAARGRPQGQAQPQPQQQPGRGRGAGMSREDAAAVLGVDLNTATADDIKRAARQAWRRYHPDNKQTGDPQQFQRVTEATDVLVPRPVQGREQPPQQPAPQPQQATPTPQATQPPPTPSARQQPPQRRQPDVAEPTRGVSDITLEQLEREGIAPPPQQPREAGQELSAIAHTGETPMGVASETPAPSPQPSPAVPAKAPAAPPAESKLPTLTRATRSNDIIYLDYDGTGVIPDPNQLNEQIRALGYDASVVRFHTDVITGASGNVRFRVDVHPSPTRKGTDAAAELYRTLFGTDAPIRNQSEFERAAPIEDRLNASIAAGLKHEIGQAPKQQDVAARKAAAVTDDDLPQRQPTRGSQSVDPDEPVLTREERDMLGAPLDGSVNFTDLASSQVETSKTTHSVDSPRETIADVLAAYDDGTDNLTVADVADRVEAIDDAPPHVKQALAEYRQEQADDRELSGRGDMDAADDRLLASLRSPAPKTLTSPTSVTPVTPAPSRQPAPIGVAQTSQIERNENRQIDGSVTTVTPSPRDYGTLDAPNRDGIGRHFAEQLAQGKKYPTINDARAEASQLLGGQVQPGTPAAKHVDEAVEIGVTRAARKIVRQGKGDVARTFEKLVDLYERQPNLGVRTSTSMAQQAYSTPAPLAFAAQHLAGIGPDTSVYEPTAGNGMLLTAADPKKVTANELNPERAAALRAQGYDLVTENDATTHLPARKVDAVIANPPFGAVRDDAGQRRMWTVDGVTTAEVDHAISLQALKAMKDDGRAVLILGTKGHDAKTPIEKRKAYLNRSVRPFYDHLYRNYRVTQHFTVSGGLYARQGASFPVDVIVIEGRGTAPRKTPWAELVPTLQSWSEVADVLPQHARNLLSDAARPNVETGVVPAERDQRGSGDRPAAAERPHAELGDVPDAAQQPPRVADRPAGRPGAGGASGRPGVPRPARPHVPVAEPQPPAGAADRAERGDRDAAGAGARGAAEGLPAAGDVDAGRQPTRDVGPARDESRGLGEPPPAVQRVKRAPKQDAATEHQVPYKPASSAERVGTLVPKNMATAAGNALDAVKKSRGEIDAFVASELGYPAEKIGDHFSAEQLDALALAIHNHKNGAGFVLGDQTGVGKGRVVAGLIRYAQQQDLLPVFVTQAPNLFADMVRDLTDIGSNTKAKPFNILPTNDLTGKDKLPLPDGRTLATTSDHKNVFLRAVTNYLEGKGLTAAVRGQQQTFDAIFTTYNQLQSVQGNATFRQTALRRLQRRAFFILDESHEAGGTRQSGWRGKDEPAVGGRAGFVRDLIKNAPGVAYSSATFAKRAEVMDLYSKTDMKLAVKGDVDKLPAAIAKGGVPLQQAVSAMLAESGQYVRRERTFEGVDFLPATVDIGLKRADAISGIFRAIRDFDQLKQGAVSEMEDEITAVGERYGNDTSTGDAGISSSNFTSIVHNLVDQSLLSLKVDRMAQTAIAAARAGERPVVAVDNTLESALDRYIRDKAARPGDRVELTFKDVLRRYLERSREVVITDEGGNSSQHYLTDAELGPKGVKAYKAAAKVIEDADLDLPASPIDRLIFQLEAAGLKVGEITGRNWRLKYDAQGNATLAERPKEESGAAGRVRAVKDFNDGKLDVLIINRAGSTGLSLHAHPDFGNRGRRHMIIGQPAKNIDVFMQTLGRVHRTGQVVPPKYTLLLSNAPAENRPAASLVKKLASLNANVTADRTGAVSFDAPDIMNEVGDEVVAEYLAENDDLAETMGNPLPRKPSGAYATENAASRVSGRAVLLPVAEQQKFWQDVIERYNAKVAELDAIGENPLVAKTLDLDAVTTRKMPLFDGDARATSPFAGPAHLEEVDMKLIGKPYAAEQVSQKLRELYQADTDGAVVLKSRQWAKGQIEQLEAATEKYRDARLAKTKDNDVAARVDADIQRNLATVSSYIDRMPPGTAVQLVTPGGEEYEGVVMSIAQRGKPKNPAAAGSWVMSIAVADAAREVKVPISATTDIRDDGYAITPTYERLADTLPKFDAAASKSRETRYIATGNLLAAYDKLKAGQIVHFTGRDAGTRQGILLPKKFDLSAFLDREPVRFDTSTNVLRFLDAGFELTTPDQGLRVILAGDGSRLVLEAAKSKAKGARYTLSEKLLRAAAPAEFVSAGNKMRLTIEGDIAKRGRVLDVLLKEFGLVSHKDKEAARQALGLPSLDEQTQQMKEGRSPLPPGRRRQGGYVAAGPFTPFIVPVAAAGHVGKIIVDNGVWDLIDRVRSKGTTSAKLAADLGENAVNSAKAAMGMLAPRLDAAMKVTGGGASPARHKALWALQRVQRTAGKPYGVARIVDAVEDRLSVTSAAEREVVDVIRRLADATGAMLHANNVQQLGPHGWRVFPRIPGGKVFVRLYTPEGFGIIMRGAAAPGWRELAQGIADLNNIPLSKVHRALGDLRDGMLAEGPDASFKRINAEFTREWKRVPTHVFVHGDPIEVFQTHPYSYVRRLAENTAARVGFIRHFGQDTTTPGPVQQLREKFTLQTGDPKALVQMMRALNGVPVEAPIIEAGTPAGQLARFLSQSIQLVKAGLLSMSVVQNIPEPLGSTQAFGSLTDLMRGSWQLARHPQATVAVLESLGSITKDVMNIAFQPGRPISSAVRALSELSSRVLLHKPINELQEKLAASVALAKVQRMQAGKGNGGDVYDLLAFGWEMADAKRLAAGGGTQAEYNRVVRQAPAKLMGGTMTPAERTRWEHNRIFRIGAGFRSYMESKLRNFLKNLVAWAKVMRRGEPRLMLAGNVKFARNILGTAAAGGIAFFLLALATGGTLGLKIAAHEAKDAPMRFAMHSWLYSTFSGPYGAVLRNTSQGGDAEDWANAILPVMVMNELRKFALGKGQYRGEGWMERAGTLADRFLPVKRVYDTVAADVFGRGTEAHRLRVASRAYWRWRYRNFPPPQFTPREANERDERFRLAMLKAHRAVQNFEDPTAHIAEAFGVGREGKNLAASMRARLMLVDDKLGHTEQEAEQNRQALRRHIGDEAYGVLEAHDRILSGWIESLKLAEDADDAQQLRERFGERLVEQEQQRDAAAEGTMDRSRLDSISSKIDREAANIRKAPITQEQRRQARDGMLDALLPK